MAIITLENYQNMLLDKGGNLSEVRKNQSDMIMNATFMNDVGYKKVYILSKENGWEYVDAKYGKHASYSILKDAVDSYLQFRPQVHYPVGTYVFIPDDTSSEIGFYEYQPEDPFKDLNFTVSKLWMIVGRDDSTQFVRYNIIRCNWNFRWVYKLHGEYQIMHVWGSVRNANSYTSGVWTADYMTQLDQITSAWMPDTYQLYGDKLSEFDICDSRYIQHDERFMITNNIIDPKIYRVTKVQDLVPLGLVKMTLKQTEFDPRVDNRELLLCNYYDRMGEIKPIETEIVDDKQYVSIIYQGIINSNGELEKGEEISDIVPIDIGKTIYFITEFYDEDFIRENVESEYRIEVVDENNTLSNEDKKYLEKLVKITVLDVNTISIKVGKSMKVSGTQYKLFIQDKDGHYSSSIVLEVN